MTRRLRTGAWLWPLIVVSVAVLVVGSALLVLRPTSSTPATTPTSTNPTGARVDTLMLPSGDAGGVPRRVLVYRPRVADSDRLPVLYLLHGYPGTPEELFSLGLDRFLDASFTLGGSPFVVVAPDGNVSPARDTEWADAADGSVKLEHFLTTTLIDAVEGTHRRSRDDRAIAGFSMGGFGAVNIAFRHPDLYGQAVSIAGYFHVDDPDGVFAHDRKAELANSPDQHPDAARRVRLLLMDGDGEDLPLVTGEAARFAGVLAGDGIKIPVIQLPGGHDLDYLESQMPLVATFLGRGWRHSRAPAPATTTTSTARVGRRSK